MVVGEGGKRRSRKVIDEAESRYVREAFRLFADEG
jgi:hypothetical protein